MMIVRVFVAKFLSFTINKLAKPDDQIDRCPKYQKTKKDRVNSSCLQKIAEMQTLSHTLKRLKRLKSIVL